MFARELISHSEFGLSVHFASLHNDKQLILTAVYGPCVTERKRVFVDWIKNLHMPMETDWMILGDFNLMRKPENRNKPGGSQQEMFWFNDAISVQGLSEIELQGRKFTWSNLQPSPLLEKLDWIVMNSTWTLSYPTTTAKALSMNPSNHCPCLVTISIDIPRGGFFRFENYWLQHDQFSGILEQSWSTPMMQQDSAKLVTAKFKVTRQRLRQWQASLTSLKTLINNTKLVLHFLEVLGDYRDLSLQEWNFKKLLDDRLLNLLTQQKNILEAKRHYKVGHTGRCRNILFSCQCHYPA